MAEKDPLKDLVRASLATKTPTPETEESSGKTHHDTASAKAPTKEEVEPLLEVYFESDSLVERDAALDRLLDLPLDESRDVLRSMLEHDEDPVSRALAAERLLEAPGAKDAALGVLKEGLREREGFLMEHAFATLSGHLGESFLEHARRIWVSSEASAAQREWALLAIEGIDEAHALEQALRYLEEEEVGSLSDALVEACFALLIRLSPEGVPHAAGALEKRLPPEGEAALLAETAASARALYALSVGDTVGDPTDDESE